MTTIYYDHLLWSPLNIKSAIKTIYFLSLTDPVIVTESRYKDQPAIKILLIGSNPWWSY